MPFGPLRLRPEAKQLNGIDDTVELPNVDKPARREADVERFFALTFPTQTLRQNVLAVVERFSQPIGAKGVFLIESPYGSGKSHVLLTLCHVLRGQPAGQRWSARRRAGPKRRVAASAGSKRSSVPS
jgi:predicted AAA+ superfamily ATPase